MTALILASGLAEFKDYFERVPELATEAAYFAVNDTQRDALPLLKRKMREQINFPSGYLNKKRLDVRRRATRATLEAVISGRDRPTSLARFAEGATPENSRGKPIFLRIKGRGGRTVVGKQKDGKSGAFLVKLRNNNLGLAIRLPKGQEPDRAYKPVPLTTKGGEQTGAWLLYGPSVDQVLQGVAGDVSEEISTKLANNWLRQFSRLSVRG